MMCAIPDPYDSIKAATISTAYTVTATHQVLSQLKHACNCTNNTNEVIQFT